MLLSSVLPLSSGDVSVELDVVCHVAVKRMQRSVQWDVNVSIVRTQFGNVQGESSNTQNLSDLED